MRYAGLLPALLALLASCGSQSEPKGLTWAKAPGGGTVAFFSPTADSSQAVRCMPSDVDELCLLVNQVDGTSMTFQVVSRADIKEPDLWTHKDGYQCMFILGLATSQSVLKSGATLISASAPYIGNSKLPSREETQEFMKLNVPDGKARYFDCERVAELFGEGSIATAGTSALTRDMLE